MSTVRLTAIAVLRRTACAAFLLSLCSGSTIAATVYSEGRIGTSAVLTGYYPGGGEDPMTGLPLQSDYQDACSKSVIGAGNLSASCSSSVVVTTPDWFTAGSSSSGNVSFSGNELTGSGSVSLMTGSGGNEYYYGPSGGSGRLAITVSGKYVFGGGSGTHYISFMDVFASGVENVEFFCQISVNDQTITGYSLYGCTDYISVPFGVAVDFRLFMSGSTFGSLGNDGGVRLQYDLTQVAAPFRATFAPVPEPSTWMLGGIGTGTLYFLRRTLANREAVRNRRKA